MEDDHFATAACPASDLAARLFADLVRAEGELARFDRSVQDAATARSGPATPLGTRRERRERQRHVTGLRRLLADLTHLAGDRHAAVA